MDHSFLRITAGVMNGRKGILFQTESPEGTPVAAVFMASIGAVLVRAQIDDALAMLDGIQDVPEVDHLPPTPKAG